MKRISSLILPIVVLAVAVVADSASAGGRGRRANSESTYAWHNGYYHTAWGMPVALVVPPTADLQTHWGWGVGNTRITGICPQFERNWPGPGTYNRGMFKPTPRWPSHTDQFGVYYVRGPW